MKVAYSLLTVLPFIFSLYGMSQELKFNAISKSYDTQYQLDSNGYFSNKDPINIEKKTNLNENINGVKIQHSIDSVNLKELKRMPSSSIHRTRSKQNFVSIRLTDLLLVLTGHTTLLTVHYEHRMETGKFSFKVPLSIGLGLGGYPSTDNKRGYFNKTKKFSTGLGFNYYPFEKKEISLFFGPSIQYGQFEYLQRKWPIYELENIQFQENTMHFYGGLFNLGALLHGRENLVFSITMGIGYNGFVPKHFEKDPNYRIEDDMPFGAIDYEFGFNLGFNF